MIGVEPNYSQVRVMPIAEGRFIDAGDMAALDRNARHASSVTKSCAAARRHIGKRDRQTMHAALDRPHALALHMGDKHQSRRRRERRRAAIGGVSAKKLPQARIAKIAAEFAPEAGER